MLKAIIENETELTALPEPIRAEYKKNNEGKWVLDIENDKFVLSSQLGEMRDRNIVLLKERDTATEQLRKLSHVDLETYERLRSIEQDLTDQKLIKREGLDKLVEKKADEKSGAMKADFEKKLADAEKNNTELTTKLSVLTIDQEAIKEATALDVRPNAIQFVVDNIRNRAKMEGGHPVLYKADGTKDYNSATKEKTIAEAVKELVDANEFLVVPSGGGGSPRDKGKGGEFNANEPNPWKKGEHFHLGRQMELAKKNPQLAARLRQEAGVVRQPVGST